MKKNIFIISSVIFLILGVYLLTYFFLFKNNKVENRNGASIINEKSDEKEAASGKIEIVLAGNIKYPQIDSVGSKIVYFNQSNFLSASFDGKMKTSLGSYPFKEIENIAWAPQGKYAIVKDSDQYYIFNDSDSSAEIFKGGADNLVWGNIGSQLIYKFYDLKADKRSLNVSNMTGSNWQEIVEIPFRYAEIKVNPKKEQVALFSSPVFNEKTQLFIVDLVSKEKKEINKQFKGADYRWSPDGKKLLFSYTKEDGGSNLAVLYIENSDVVELNFPGLVDKCVWLKDSVNLYCAGLNIDTPVSLLPDDWRNDNVSSSDTFWKINTVEGKQERLLELDEINEEVDSTSLFLDGNEKFLFFVDRKTENLFKISLDN